VLLKVIPLSKNRALTRIDDHEIVLLEKIFNQVNTYSVMQWILALNAFQDHKAQANDQTVYVFNTVKNLAYLYRVNAQNRTIKIDAIPLGNTIWDDEVFFLDALAQTQKTSKSLPKGLIERIPDFKGNFKTETTFHFSLHCADRFGLKGLIDKKFESKLARQKLIEMAEPYSKNLSKQFLKSLKFKKYSRVVHYLQPLSQKLKIPFSELIAKLLFVTHSDIPLKIYTRDELIQLMDQMPAVELSVPANHEMQPDQLPALNRFYIEKFEEIKNDIQKIQNKNLIIEDKQGIYQLVYASVLAAKIKAAGYEVMTFPVSFATDFKTFYMQWLNMVKSRGLVSLNAKNEFDLQTINEFAKNLKNEEIFFSILNLHYLDQIEQPDAEAFFKTLTEAFRNAPKSRLLLTSVPGLPKTIQDENSLFYKLNGLNVEREWKNIEQFILEDLKIIDSGLTIQLDKKSIEQLWQMGGENTFLLSALIKDLAATLKEKLMKKKVLTADLVKNYLTQEKEYKLNQKFFKHFGETDYRHLFYAATMSFLLDIPIDHFIVGMQIENHRTIKWVHHDGSFGWTRFSPEIHHESIEDLFADIDKLYSRYESYADKTTSKVESRYILLNHELTPPPQEISLLQIGIRIFKMHLQQFPYLLQSGFEWNEFLNMTVRQRYKRDDVADLMQTVIEKYSKIFNDFKFLIQFNIQSFNDQIYETLLSRFPQTNRKQLENSLKDLLIEMGRKGKLVSPVEVMKHLINQKEINLPSYRAEQQLQTVYVDKLSEKLKKLHTYSDKNTLIRIFNIFRKFFDYYKYRNRVNDLLHVYEGIENNQKGDTLSKKFTNQLSEVNHIGTYEVLLKSLEQAFYLLKEIRSEYRTRILRVLTNPLSNLEEELSAYLGNIVYLDSHLNELPDDAKKQMWKKMVSETKNLKVGIELELKNNGIKAIQPVKIKDAIQTLGIAAATFTGAYSTYSKIMDYFSIRENLFKESVNHQINISFNYFKEASLDEKCTLANDCVLRLANLRVAENILDDPSDLNQRIRNLTQQKVILKTLTQLYKNDLDKKFLGKLTSVSEYNSSLNIYFGEKEVDKNLILLKIDLRVKEINESLIQLNSKNIETKAQPSVDIKK